MMTAAKTLGVLPFFHLGAVLEHLGPSWGEVDQVHQVHEMVQDRKWSKHIMK